jgi:hypothetical protein
MLKGLTRLAILALLASACLFGCNNERYRAEEQFGGVRKSLMAAVKELTSVPAKMELTDQPSIKGKIAVFTRTKLKSGYVNGGAYATDIFYFQGLNEVYASKPEEVGTVALLDCQTTDKGVYQTEDGKEFPAEVEDCELTMIDRSKAAVVFKKMFVKDPSAERKTTGKSVLRQTTHLDILPFLKGLPRT